MTEGGARRVGLDAPAGAAAPAGTGRESSTQLTLGLLLRLFTATADGPSRPDDESAGTARDELTAEVHSLESFERKLDLAQELGLTEIEITQAGDSSGADFLVAHPAARKRFAATLESRGLRVAALNCRACRFTLFTGSVIAGLYTRRFCLPTSWVSRRS